MTSETSPQKSIVFIHGSGCNGALWAYQSRHFARCHRVAALDLPGHGRNRDELCTRIDQFAEFVLSQIERLGLETPAIVGHSLGGAIALQIALDRPEALGKLVLVGTGARLKVLPSLLAGLLSDYSSALGTMADFVFGPDARRSVVDKAMSEMQRVPARVLYNDLAACDRFDVMQRLGEIRLPTLVIVGQDDVMTPVKYSRYLADNIPNARLEIIDDAGHMVMIEQPDRFNAAVDSFLGDRQG